MRASGLASGLASELLLVLRWAWLSELAMVSELGLLLVMPSEMASVLPLVLQWVWLSALAMASALRLLLDLESEMMLVPLLGQTEQALASELGHVLKMASSVVLLLQLASMMASVLPLVLTWAC